MSLIVFKSKIEDFLNNIQNSTSTFSTFGDRVFHLTCEDERLSLSMNDLMRQAIELLQESIDVLKENIKEKREKKEPIYTNLTKLFKLLQSHEETRTEDFLNSLDSFLYKLIIRICNFFYSMFFDKFNIFEYIDTALENLQKVVFYTDESALKIRAYESELAIRAPSLSRSLNKQNEYEKMILANNERVQTTETTLQIKVANLQATITNLQKAIQNFKF